MECNNDSNNKGISLKLALCCPSSCLEVLVFLARLETMVFSAMQQRSGSIVTAPRTQSKHSMNEYWMSLSS